MAIFVSLFFSAISAFVLVVVATGEKFYYTPQLT